MGMVLLPIFTNDDIVRASKNNLVEDSNVANPVEGKLRLQNKAHPPSESTATFIRELLLKERKSYPYAMWKKWCNHLARLQMKSPKFSSFTKYIYTLVRAGLIRKTTAPPRAVVYSGQLKPLKRSYYELVRSKVDDYDSWRNPQVVVWGEKMRLGKRRYRRRIMRLPPTTKRGRPRTSEVLPFLEKRTSAGH